MELIQKFDSIYIVTVLLFANLSFVNSQQYEIINIEKIYSDSLLITKPVWNSDGNRILFTGGHSRGLYIYYLENKEIICVDKDIRIKSKPIWLKNNEIVYFKGNELKTIANFKSTDESLADTVFTVNIKNKKVEATRLSDNLSWEITPKDDWYYNPVVSPNGKLIVIHLKSEMYLYSTNGGGLLKHLGTGIASSWTGDSGYIVYFLDETTDGHNISKSDLYLISIDGLFKQKITQTDDIIEMWPAVSSSGGKIVYVDEKTGSVYMGELKMIDE